MTSILECLGTRNKSKYSRRKKQRVHTLVLIPNPESCVPSDGADDEIKLTGDWLGPPCRPESHCEAADDDMGLSERDDGASKVNGENRRCPGLGGN